MTRYLPLMTDSGVPGFKDISDGTLNSANNNAGGNVECDGTD